MKELIDYLERKIELCTEMNMPLEKFAYTDALKKARALQLQQTGVMRSALNQEEAFKIFTQHNKYDGFIQWKGTDVCMDFHCECGHHNHYDDYFAYVIKCSECGSLYAPSSNVEMIKINEASSFIESNH